MAICVYEALARKTSLTKVQIFASDISESAIVKARSGIYKKSELEGLSASRIQRFFNNLGGNFQVKASG